MKTLAFIIFLFPFVLLAQDKLSGRITNFSGEPFGYCKLILVRDSVTVKTTVTDTLGYYSLENIAAGSYHLSIRVPFKKIDTLITVGGSTTFNLEIEDGNTLEDVEIISKKQTVIRKVDRTIFDPANIPALAGGNASDVIEFAPGVYINDDNIQVAGGGSAQVMLNDKLIPLDGAQLISFIRSIPTEDIQHIEIIPIPPVKYAASVHGSLINIQLVLGAKSRQSRGSIGGDIGQRFYSQQGLSGNYAYRSGKFSLYTNASFNNGKYHFIGSKQIDYDTLQWSEDKTETYQSGYANGSIGLNYELNSTTEIGFLAVASKYRSQSDERSFIEKTGTGGSYGTIDNSTDQHRNDHEAAINMNLTKRLDTLGRKIDFNADYTNYDRTGTVNFNTRSINETTDSLSSGRNLKLTTANFLSGGIDYVHPIKKATLSLGARYSYAVNTSDLSVYNNLLNPTVPDTGQSNVFNYYEQIQAVYSSLDWSLRKWSFQVGIRGENTMYTAQSPTSELEYENHYFQLTPKVFALYETKNGFFWNFNYSRYFYRPNYSDLNPFRYYSSAYTYSTGNPYLKPTILNNLSVSASVRDFQISLSAVYTNKMQTDVTVYDNATQLQQITTSNLFSAKSLDISMSYYKTIRKRTTVDASLSFMYMNRIVTSTIESQNLKNLSGFTYVTLTQTLDKKETFFFKTTLMYITPYFEQIALTTTKPRIDFKLKKNLLKNRINLELTFNDPFRLQTRSSFSRSNQTAVREFGYYDSQSVHFSFIYKLGNKALNVNQHNTNTTGEAGRIGK